MGLFVKFAQAFAMTLSALVLAVPALIQAAYEAVNGFIDWLNDILAKINESLNNYLNAGAKEVNVIKGSALSDFIRQNQQYAPQYSLSDLNKMRDSVINVGTNKDGDAVAGQMIHGQQGYGADTTRMFNGKNMIKVTL